MIVHVETQPTAPVCATMPSAASARDFMAGAPGSFPRLLVSYAGRTAVIALGMYAAGSREHVVRDAAAGAAVIEAALLAYFDDPGNRASAQIPSQRHIARLLNGDLRAGVSAGVDVLLRMLEISGGMILVGNEKHRFRYALGGSLAVEFFLFLYS